MVLNFWSIILIASAGQSVFLIFLLIFRPSSNKNALKLLVALLFILLLTTIHNLWYAGRIYYSYPAVSGFGRGLILTIGPLFYLYTRAITDGNFKLSWHQWLHAIPYLIGLGMVISQDSPSNMDEGLLIVDAFMTTGIKASYITIVRFALYIVHMLVYIFLSRRLISYIASDKSQYLIPIEKRSKWIKQLNLILGAIALIFLISLGDIFISGLYSYHSNFILTLLVSAFIYMVAYQAVAQDSSLLPGFGKKYGSVNIKADQKSSLLPALLGLLETEKIFLNPELKLGDVAARLHVQSHVLTSLINTQLGKSFFELLNQYRVQEFIEKANQPEYNHLSIFGIAQEVGYKSKSSFNTAFKKQMGVTPSQYLKNAD
ncbi:MAG: helix-turn-helix transcriptional regulator [Roseivirga sp.]|nr:helix-turn-helix transcriptional regulator [Roseivirga sp.]